MKDSDPPPPRRDSDVSEPPPPPKAIKRPTASWEESDPPGNADTVEEELFDPRSMVDEFENIMGEEQGILPSDGAESMPSDIVDQDRMSELVQKADELMAEHQQLASSRSDDLEDSSSKPQNHAMADWETRVAPAPIHMMEQYPSDPPDASTADPSAGKPADPQAHVVTRVAPIPGPIEPEAQAEPTVVTPMQDLVSTAKSPSSPPAAAPIPSAPQGSIPPPAAMPPRSSIPPPASVPPPAKTAAPAQVYGASLQSYPYAGSASTAPSSVQKSALREERPSVSVRMPLPSKIDASPTFLTRLSTVLSETVLEGLGRHIQRAIDVVGGLSRRSKWVIGGVGIACVGIIIVLLVVSGDPASPSTEEISQSAVSNSDPSGSDQKGESISKQVAEKSAEEAPAPLSNTVTISLEGAPEGSVVKVNGIVSPLPLRLPKSSEIVTVVVNADGYKRWRRRVVPDKDRHLPVRMTQLKGKKKKNKQRSR